jgi:hypothetical protein
MGLVISWTIVFAWLAVIFNFSSKAEKTGYKGVE